MKSVSARISIALVIAGVVVVIYTGFLLVSNYLSQVDLQNAALEQSQNEVEKQTNTTMYL